MAFVIPYAIMAAGALIQGQNAKKAANANAEVKEQQAVSVGRQSVAREELQRSGARRLIGDQLAIGAESGVDLSGSRADILRQSLYDSELDALNIRYEGALNQQALRTGATFDRFSGTQAQAAAGVSAVGYGAQAYGKWLDLNRPPPELITQNKSYTSPGGTLPYGGLNGSSINNLNSQRYG